MAVDGAGPREERRRAPLRTGLPATTRVLDAEAPVRDQQADADAMRAAVAGMRWGTLDRCEDGFAGRAEGVGVE